jgi:hypothetical protein
MDNRERFRSIVISAGDPSGAMVDLPFHMELQRQVKAGVEATP